MQDIPGQQTALPSSANAGNQGVDSGQATALRGPSRPELLRDETLADILTATARERPSHAALIWGARVVTYGELEERSNAIGEALARRGVAPGAVIGLLLPRGADLLIAQAGIAKSGAAWLPLDAETPIARVQSCLRSAKAAGILTSRDFLARLGEHSGPAWAGEDKSDAAARRPYREHSGPGWAVEDLVAEVGPRPSPRPARGSDPAYVIFTSGSTGEPKGIAISQRSICHLLRSENEMLGVHGEDRVYQGFSVAFDMSFEEIWISYLVGATLWIAPPGLVGDPEMLVEALGRERVTVLHAAPTLMGLLGDPPPCVRLINLGGERCPDTLAQSLARPGRKVFNTYGPTETTVTATIAELKPGKPVTIGMPLPNYGALVVDEEGCPLPAGKTGELCVFGPGLALGYLGRPDLTAARFLTNPLAENPAEGRMYMTGDLARMEPGGPIHCLGRADSQVKVRGFRVELDEISARLKALPGVGAASAVLRPFGESDQIVGFIVPAAGRTLEPAELRRELARSLPQYMIPAHFEIVAQLPLLSSTKVDRKALRDIPLRSLAGNEERATARDEEEAALFAALKKLFPGGALDADADFFEDLGGHSLLAARLVSILREDARYARLSVQEVYRERRLGGIAAAMGRCRAHGQPSARAGRWERHALRHFLCGAAQGLVAPIFILLHMADWLGPFFVYQYFTGDPGDSIWLAAMYGLETFIAAQLAAFGVAVAGKRLAAWRLKAGRYPLWGVTYFRWWLADKFCELPDVYLLAATPWLALYYRALGARIGKDVIMDNITVGAAELLTIEDGATLGSFVNIENARVAGGELILGAVHIGRDAAADSSAVLENDTALGKGARLKGQSALGAGRRIPDGETWQGAPARAVVKSGGALPPRREMTFAMRWIQATLHAATALGVATLFFLPTFPAFMLIDWVDAHTLDFFESQLSPAAGFGFFLLLAIPASAAFIGLTILVTALLRRAFPRQAAGMFSVNGFAFWRKRLMSLILDCSLRVLHGVYASVYAPTWLRCLGAKVGRHAEISTAEGMVPELLSLGDDSFIADSAILGDEEMRGGWMILRPTRIGNRSFIGNAAYIPDGTVVPDDVLIGVQTAAPSNEQMKSGQTWIGSPPILLPARECPPDFPESLTFRPSMARRLGRACFEALRIVLPLAVVIASGYLIIILVMPLADAEHWKMRMAAALSLAGCLFGFASFLMVAALKWTLIGRYRPLAAPMWTPFVWMSEAITNLYESLAVPNALDILRGTPMLPWALRLLGARIGRGVYMNTTDLTEFDCVRIGDGAELNAWCGPQTHLFEDRIMKIGRVDIGARVTVGARSTILYDTRVGEGVALGPLTLVAKGERLPDWTSWEGSPAAPANGK